MDDVQDARTEMTDAQRYRAVLARDPRFDGRFFTGVLTTGIYCRPVCPARAPHRRNVRFFAHAAAAEAEGFRPCRRCRPETAPGTPAWLGTSATVSRGLRLIADGMMDGGGVETLADRLGVGSRHLRRLFLQHVGATPIAVAQTRRLHFARSLLDGTDLPMGDVAAAAGFASERRFRAAVRTVFGVSPTELRAAARGPRGGAAPGCVALRLAYREPFDAAALLDYLGRRAIPGVEEVRDGAYRRTFALGDAAGVLCVRADTSRSVLVVEMPLAARRCLLDAAERVRRIFDANADPAAIAARLGRDPALRASVRRRPGLRVPGAWDPFELTIRAILGQQVSVAGATTLAGRLVRAFGRPLPGADPTAGPALLFPEPAALARADVASIGMPSARAAAIREVARRVASGALPLAWGADPERTRDALAEVPGVGPWTAGYVAMRALALPDAFLPDDLGVRRALADGRGLRPKPREVLARAEPWRPWRAYAVMHLWAGDADGPRPAKREKETKRCASTR